MLLRFLLRFSSSLGKFIHRKIFISWATQLSLSFDDLCILGNKPKNLVAVLSESKTIYVVLYQSGNKNNDSPVTQHLVIDSDFMGNNQM